MSRPIASYIGIVFTIFFTVLGQLAVKKGVMAVGTLGSNPRDFTRFFISAFTNAYIVMGLASAVLAAMFWLIALRMLPLSYAYPFMALTFVLVPVGARFFFGESVPPTRWFGIIFIIFGVWLSYR